MLLLLWGGAVACASPRAPFLPAPIWVYNNWSAYDELSDKVPLTEDLAMRELRELLRLRAGGVHIDYYVMDAFWYDPDGGYRTWRKGDWPNGPDRWLEACRENGIKPGLWFATNTLEHLRPAAAWRDSLAPSDYTMTMYAGGFLSDFMDILQYWYDRGIRLFKFDFADMDATASADEGVLSPGEVQRRNERALHDALAAFRRKNPDVVLVAFNGFVGDVGSAKSFVHQSSFRWLDVFDALYAGDPRPSQVPEMSFWRSVDIYTDRMVRRFDQAGVPLSRVDSTGFMIGDTGTNYGRRTAGWQAALLLLMARGGWVNTIHGNLELLDNADVRWFAKAQGIYGELQRTGTTDAFGGIAGDRYPYGFVSKIPEGSLYVVVNPAQAIQTAELPGVTGDGRVLFHDAGFEPTLQEEAVRLGPGQVALVGFGRYADPVYDLGTGSDIRIPLRIEPIAATFRRNGQKLVYKTTVTAPERGDIRVIFRQVGENGAVKRSTSWNDMGKFFVITAAQDGNPVPVEINYDRVVWSGMSWAAGEIRHSDFTPGAPILIRISSADEDWSLRLEGQIYAVEY
ncbi:MAG TPA: hypothetical protein VLX67_07185 [Stellaceae bacterium]|nr:hypothetical protein [Stellaceae bacterium]